MSDSGPHRIHQQDPAEKSKGDLGPPAFFGLVCCITRGRVTRYMSYDSGAQSMALKHVQIGLGRCARELVTHQQEMLVVCTR